MIVPLKLNSCKKLLAFSLCVASLYTSAQSAPPERSTPAPQTDPNSAPAGFTFIQGITYRNIDGIDLVADLYLPPGVGPFPGIVFLHGGGWRNGNRLQLRRQAAYMAQHGMVGMAIEYRLAPAHPFPAALDDAKQAVVWLREHASTYHVAPSKIAAVGSSAGGHLAAMLGVESTDRSAPAGSNVQAVVAFNGIFDFAAMPPSNMVSDFLGKPCADDIAVCREASPLSHAHPNEPPFLILHGTEDRTAPYAQAAAFVEKLKAAGDRAELFTATGAPHTFWAQPRWFDPSQQAMCSFLQTQLLPGVMQFSH